MRFWIVEDGELVEYERLGECGRCGGCCCSLRITCKLTAFTSRGSIDEIDWADYEGHSVFLAQGLVWHMKAKTKEEERTCGSFEKGTCAIWKQDKFPAVCRYWPVHPDNLEHFPDCGFSFRKLGEAI